MPDLMRLASTVLLSYLRQTSLRETDVQRRLREETSRLQESGWAVVPEQTQFLALLVQISGAKRVLELGTFTGANKRDYGAYFDRAMVLVRTDGVLAFDNVFWSGNVLNKANQEKSTVAIRTLNERLHADERLSISMLPLDDGLTVAWKRA